MIAASLSIAWASGASAINGDELHKRCGPINTDTSNMKNQGFSDLYMCFGYINAVVDITTGGYCLPDGVTRGMMTKVVVTYLVKHPERLHKVAALLVDEAFAGLSMPEAEARQRH